MTLTQQIIMIGMVILGTVLTRFLPFADLDKTTKNPCGAADNKFKYAMEQKAISIIVADCFFAV